MRSSAGCRCSAAMSGWHRLNKLGPPLLILIAATHIRLLSPSIKIPRTVRTRTAVLLYKSDCFKSRGTYQVPRIMYNEVAPLRSPKPLINASSLWVGISVGSWSWIICLGILAATNSRVEHYFYLDNAPMEIESTYNIRSILYSTSNTCNTHNICSNASHTAYVTHTTIRHNTAHIHRIHTRATSTTHTAHTTHTTHTCVNQCLVW